MDTLRIKNLHLSNLDFISYQSQELIRNKGSNIFYSDFYFFYIEYIKYLNSISWSNKSIEAEIKLFPKISKPRGTFSLLLFSAIPLLALIFSSLQLIFLAYCIPVFALIIIINSWMVRKNKMRLNEIVQLCTHLKEEIENSPTI